MEGLELEPGMGQDTPLLSDPHCPFRDRVGSHAAGAEVLRFRLTLSLSLLSVSHPCMETLASERGSAEARGPCGLSVADRGQSCLLWADVQCLHLISSLCLDSASGASPFCSSQLITIPCFGHPILLWNHSVGLAGALMIFWRVLRC